jgi:uncharacterized membrane protein
MKLYEYLFVFLVGGFAYSLTEILYRGETHWTMLITGGVVMMGLYFIRVKFSDYNIFMRLWFGTIWIIFVEFTVGLLVNIILGWNVWDYSDIWGNIMGQVCIVYGLLWYGICIPAEILNKSIYNRFHNY